MTIFLLVIVIIFQLWGLIQMSANDTALTLLTTAVTDATNALKDLAAKVAAAPSDISGPLTTLANGLEAAVAAAGEPVTSATPPTA